MRRNSVFASTTLQHYSLFCADSSWHATRLQYNYTVRLRHGTLINNDAAVSVYTAYNDSHRNARKYQIDSQAPENTSHFAMRIALFSSHEAESVRDIKFELSNAAEGRLRW